MELNLQKEEFSLAYIRAVATVAGYYTTRPEFDRDSGDLTIAAVGAKGTSRSPRLDLQAKCTSLDVAKDDTINFPLEVANYEDLRAPSVHVPRILIVVLVPSSVDSWLFQNETELALRHCGYWVSLRGFPEIENTSTITIRIPRSQMFSPVSLQGIMGKIDRGENP